MSRNAVAPDSAEKIISFFGPHKGQAVDPHSLYLPLVPRAKNYYLPNIQLPIWVLQETLRNIIRNTLPFVLNVEGYPSNISEFNDIITQMREDREFVFHTPVRLEQRYEGDEHPKAVDVRLETIFAKRLLDRLSNVIGEASGQGSLSLSFYTFLLDLVAQAVANYQRFQHSRDEFGNYWLILRNAAPYREGSFFQDETVLIQCIGPLLKVIVGETEDDIDEWYRYEWLAQFVRNLHQLSRRK